MITIRLKRGKSESLKRFHPWIFSGAIASMSEQPQEGEIVEVVDSEGHFAALGHYQIGSITVRVLSFERSRIDTDFWKRRLHEAWLMRKAIGVTGLSDNNIYRLVHGEGDRLPGLIIDVYGNTAVMQAHSVGMHRQRMQIAEALAEATEGEISNVYYKSETTLPFKAGLGQEDGFILGGETGNIATEYGLQFHIDWLKGQKTGFFVDQRENRRLLEHYAKGKKVLNMFCYTGGFSVYALRGGDRVGEAGAGREVGRRGRAGAVPDRLGGGRRGAADRGCAGAGVREAGSSPLIRNGLFQSYRVIRKIAQMDQQRQYIIPVAERDQIIGEPIGIYADFDAAQKPGDSPGQAVEWIQIHSHAFDTSM